MRDLSATSLEAEQKKLSVKPSLPWVFTSGVTSYTYDTDRILRCEHSEAHDSHKAELILQNSDGNLTSLDLKGYQVAPKWGLITSAGSEISETAPLWVDDMTLHSSPLGKIARLACSGIPDRLSRDKAQSTYRHHWSSTKTVKTLITEVASNTPTSEELTEELFTLNLSGFTPSIDGYIDLDDTEYGADGSLMGAGQRISIPNRAVTKIAFRLKRTGTWPAPSGNVTFYITDAETEEHLVTKVLGAANTIGAVADWYEVTLDTPVTIDKEITWVDGKPTGGVWIWCHHADGTATDYISVYYYNTNWRSGQNIIRMYSIGTPVPAWETVHQDCAYRYKYNFDGIEAFDTSAKSYDVVYDSEDSLIDTYIPADAFAIGEGEARLDTIDKLLSYTACERMFKADGKMHILQPTTSGEVYDYEYHWRQAKAAADHQFFSKANREALVQPNKIVVKSLEGDATQYEGSATSAASFALMPVLGSPIRARLASNAQGAAIAAAYISRLEVASQRGSLTVPMNVGAELWDYIKATDARLGDTRVGNQGYLKRVYNPRASNPADKYNMTFGFGGVARKGVPGAKASEIRPDISDLSAETLRPYVTWGYYDTEIYPRIFRIFKAIAELQDVVWPEEGEKLGESESILGWIHNINVALGLYDIDTMPTEDELAEKLTGFLRNLVEDSSPQLGGNLDCNGKQILGAGIISAGAGALYLTSGNVSKIFKADGDLDMEGQKIVDMGTPIDNYDAATKKYVDDNAGDVDNPMTADLDAGAFDITNLKTLKIYKAGVLIGHIIADDADRLYIKSAAGKGMYLSSGNDAMIISAGASLKQINTDGDLDMASTKIIDLEDPTANQDAATKKYVDDNAGLANAVEWTEPARSIDTTYTNSTGYPVLVVVTVDLPSGGGVADLKVHASADPPTTRVSACLNDSADEQAYGTLVGIIKNGYKYRVNDLNGLPAIIDWHEYAIGKA